MHRQFSVLFSSQLSRSAERSLINQGFSTLFTVPYFSAQLSNSIDKFERHLVWAAFQVLSRDETWVGMKNYQGRWGKGMSVRFTGNPTIHTLTPTTTGRLNSSQGKGIVNRASLFGAKVIHVFFPLPTCGPRPHTSKEISLVTGSPINRTLLSYYQARSWRTQALSQELCVSLTYSSCSILKLKTINKTQKVSTRKRR